MCTGFMCKWNGDDVNHLFLHCAVVGKLWSMIFCLFGVSWVMQLSVKRSLVSWKGRFAGRGIGEVWWVVSLCLIYNWKERNARCFEGHELSVMNLKSLYEWTLLSLSLSVEGFLDFMDSYFCTQLVYWGCPHLIKLFNKFYHLNLKKFKPL